MEDMKGLPSFFSTAGADVNVVDGAYRIALKAVAAGSNVLVIKLLLDCGAECNESDGRYSNALQAAMTCREQLLKGNRSLTGTAADYEAVIQLLVDHGAGVIEIFTSSCYPAIINFSPCNASAIFSIFLTMMGLAHAYAGFPP